VSGLVAFELGFAVATFELSPSFPASVAFLILAQTSSTSFLSMKMSHFPLLVVGFG